MIVDSKKQEIMKTNPYKNLSITLSISFVIMYAVMFFNVDKLDHIYLSLTRFYMSLLMVAPMAILMIVMMRTMYTNKKTNSLISMGSFFVFVLALYCLRTQAFISDAEYMRAMIPHHSSAIMTSRHATISSPEVRTLADSIIQSQRREIDEMKTLLNSHE